MGKRAVGLAVTASIAIAALACEDIARVSDFQFDDAVDAAGAADATGYHGPCNACPVSAAALQRPPCPVPGDAPDDGQVHVYVWRKLHLGFSDDPAHTLDPTAYDTNVGQNLDCSTREPLGLPVLCAANAPDASWLVPWAPYPLGIDNVLSQRIFSYLSSLGQQQLGTSFVPLDLGISSNWEQGKASILDVVYNWNGTPNDPKVSCRFTSSLGTVGGATPKWDGSDQWISAVAGPDPSANSFEIPQTNFATDDAYVTNGVLVADLSAVDPANLYVVNNGSSVEVSLHKMVFTGRITEGEIAYGGVSALWSLDDFKNSASDIANYLSGCDAPISQYLCGLLPELADQAADMPLDPSASPAESCNALSMTFAADAYPAHVGSYESVSAAAGCPVVCP